MSKTKIGIVGIGVISGIYLKNITETYKELEIVAVCDLVKEKALKAQEEYKIPTVYDTMHELFADADIEIVLNLTRPYEHFEVTKAALLAGKHVFTEKPLGATYEEAVDLYKIAEEQGLRIGGAPDTFMGGGIQTCRKLIEDGYIGDVVGASAYMVCRGHETWHEDPEFYYKFGGGPMLDMGPYYITALVNLLGGVDYVSGMSKISYPKRTITSEPLSGTVIDVDVPTYITGQMQFESGAIGTIFTTFDAYIAQVPRIEIYGSQGTLSVPDPNYFDGPVKLYRPYPNKPSAPTPEDFKEIPIMFDYTFNSRGLGIADMAKAIKTDRPHRASANQILHVIEVLTSFDKSSEKKEFVKINTPYTKEKSMVYGCLKGILD